MLNTCARPVRAKLAPAWCLYQVVCLVRGGRARARERVMERVRAATGCTTDSVSTVRSNSCMCPARCPAATYALDST